VNAWKPPRTGDGSAACTRGALLSRASARPVERTRLALSQSGWRVYPSNNCRLLGKAASMFSDILRRYALKGVALCALTLLATACAGDGEPETAPTDPEASATTSVSSEPVTEPSPTSDPDAWRRQFSSSQLKAYEAALRRWQSYEARAEPIWAKGEYTPAAELLFKEFFPNPIWRQYQEELKTYEAYNVKIEGIPKVYWAKAATISEAGDAVTIRECIDYRATTTTQNDEPTEPVAARQQPVLREVTLNRPEGYDWLIYAINKTPGAGGKKDKSCEPLA